jgi:hypothetical protein
MFNCYAWADATDGDDSIGVHVLGGTNYINGGIIRGTSTGNGTGIKVESGASVYISGMPLVICESGWEVWGSGNVYGAICTPDGRVFQYNGLTTSQRMVGWDHYTYVSKTLAADAFTVTGGTWFRVQGQGVADDDLSTINAGYTGTSIGQVIFITASPLTTITIKDGVGNITNPVGGGDIVLDDQELVVVLLKDGANSWIVVTDPTAAADAGGYPFDTKELTVDPSDADAAYTTVALAAAAAGAGDCIRVGAGTHTVNAVDIPSGVDLRGSGTDVTILQTTTALECVNFQGANRCSDMTIQNTYDTASTIYAVKFEGADVECRNVAAVANNATGSSYAWNPRSTTCKLYNCTGEAHGPADHRAVSTFGGSVVLLMEGGWYDGDDYDASAGVVGDVVTFNDPMLENSTINSTGTTQGCWADNTGDITCGGGWNTWTPTVTQSGAVAVTVNRARYKVVNDICHTEVQLTCTAAGTGNNAIVIGGQPAAIQPAWTGYWAVLGHVMVHDAGTAYYVGVVLAVAATTWHFMRDAATLGYIGQDPNFALAIGDVISINATYEV